MQMYSEVRKISECRKNTLFSEVLNEYDRRISEMENNLRILTDERMVFIRDFRP